MEAVVGSTNLLLGGVLVLESVEGLLVVLDFFLELFLLPLAGLDLSPGLLSDFFPVVALGFGVLEFCFEGVPSSL